MPTEESHLTRKENSDWGPSDWVPNGTEIPNVFLDILPTLKGDTLKVYYSIAYGSFSFPRTYPAPTANNISAMCGMDILSTAESINELLEMGVIFGTSERNPGFRAIGGQEDDPRWPHEKPDSYNLATGEGNVAILSIDGEQHDPR